MTENQGDRPDESSAASASHTPPETSSAPTNDAPTTPVARPEVAPPAMPPLPRVASQTAPAAGSAQPTPGAPPQAPAWEGQRPAQPPYPQAPYQGAPQPGYAAPDRAGYAGQSFGITPGQTQPTLPIASTEEAAPRKRSNAGMVAGLIVAAALVGGAAGLGGAYAGVSMWGGSEASPIAGPVTVTVNDTDEVNATTGIAARVVPSVVTISATSGSGSGGTGSGVVLSEDGYVVTNTHVVTLDGQTGDATIRATTSDGRVYEAELVGTDPTYDLAVIRLVDAEGLTPVEFAASSDLNVGDETVAVGAPLGLSNTVTTGIVSALNRSIEVASSAAPEDDQPSEGQEGGSGESPFFFDFGQGEQGGQATETIKIAVIQTDAAINPGNSGGALVDDEGRLIGINVAIASAGGASGQAGSIGVGFAIPSDVAQRVANEIIDNGEATHGLLGASVVSTANVEDATIAGAYIQEVVDGGPAAGAGLREGDIVTAFNDLPITSSVDLTAQVRAVAAGSEATIAYVRDGETRTVEVTLGTFGS